VRAYELAALDFAGGLVGPPDFVTRKIVGEVIDALVFDKLLRKELARLGLDEAGATKLVADTLPTLPLEALSRARSDDPESIGGRERHLALALAIARGALVVSEQQLTETYERRKGERTSSLGWARLEVLAVVYVTPHGGSTGIAACDEVSLRFGACARQAAAHGDPPEVTELDMTRMLPRDPKMQAFGEIMCRGLLEQMEAESAEIGCDWEKTGLSASLLAKRKAATRKGVVALHRRAAVAGADFAALAKAHGPAASARETTIALDELEPDVARAVAKLEPASVTPPIGGATRWTIARMVQRWAAGPAPLELRRSELVGEIMSLRLAEELDGLFDELRASHDVVIPEPPPSPPPFSAR
jgi:hypothetical protein